MKPPKPVISPTLLDQLDRSRPCHDWCARCGNEILLVWRDGWQALEPHDGDLFERLHVCKEKP